ncbi:hypothetical protein D3C85_1136290 [compost metagenome]
MKGKGLASLYSYRDVAPANGYNYYRLKQLDLDGTFAYSEVKLVKLTLSEDIVKLYPNPVVKEFSIVGNVKSIYSVSLTDLSGKTILCSYSNHKADVPNQLPNGIYLVKISYQDGSSNQQKIMIKR